MKIPSDVIERIEKSWNGVTAGWYWKGNPSKGQCAVTALLIQELYGGKLIRGHVGETSHYWNELPDGTEIDLTRQQFGDDAGNLVRDGYRDREHVLGRGVYDTEQRYQILKERFYRRA